MPLELTRWVIYQAAAAFSHPVWLTCGIFPEVDALLVGANFTRRPSFSFDPCHT